MEKRLINQSYRHEHFSKGIQEAVTLHGIDTIIVHGQKDVDPVIPYLSGLIACANENPDCKEFRWLREGKKWVAIHP